MMGSCYTDMIRTQSFSQLFIARKMFTAQEYLEGEWEKNCPLELDESLLIILCTLLTPTEA